MKRKHPIRRSLSPNKNASLSRVVLFILMTLALYGVYRIIEPFIPPIVMALFLVIIFHPFYVWMKEKTGNRENLAAGLTVAVVFLVVIIPFFLFSVALIQQGIELFRDIQFWVEEGRAEEFFSDERYQDFIAQPQVATIKSFLDEYFALPGEGHFNIADRLTQWSSGAIEYLAKQIVPALSATGLLLLNFFIMFLTMFCAFRDGDRMLNYVMRIVPLSKSHETMILDRIRYTARAVFLGLLLTALIQAAIAMIGFMIVGVPVLLWGAMVGLVSLAPVIGPTAIWVPMCIYLLAVGEIWQAVFLGIWCGALLSIVDNFLRPYFMRGGTGMSMIIVFFAILGGIRLFGLIGIIYGPLIFGLCAVIIYIYRMENSGLLTRLEKQ